MLGDAVRPDDEASRLAECQALADRIAAARRVREHHLWEVLRVLPSLVAAREDPEFCRTFRALMDREALDAASRALIAAADPKRQIDRLHFINGMWVVGLSSLESGSRRTYGRHDDRVAAMIVALVLADALPHRH